MVRGVGPALSDEKLRQRMGAAGAPTRVEHYTGRRKRRNGLTCYAQRSVHDYGLGPIRLVKNENAV